MGDPVGLGAWVLTLGKGVMLQSAGHATSKCNDKSLAILTHDLGLDYCTAILR
jgi:hypothetical protein